VGSYITRVFAFDDDANDKISYSIRGDIGGKMSALSDCWSSSNSFELKLLEIGE